MTYGQVKREALGLIFSRSIAGEDIAITYNNQADYVNRIPGLVYKAEMTIATTVKKIPAIVPFADLNKEEFANYDVYDLPSDCWQVKTGGILLPKEKRSIGAYNQVKDFDIRGNKIMLPKGIGDTAILDYWRYPRPISDSPSDNMELDNTPDTHTVIPMAVAAWLVEYDDYFRFSILYNDFETQLARLAPATMVEKIPIEDVYGF